MKAATAALTRWAARQRRSRQRIGSPAGHDRNAKTVRIASLSLMLLAGAMMLCAGIGFAVTHSDDNRREAERHAALRLALDEFRPVFGAGERFDAAQLGLIERRAGLKELRYDPNPLDDGGREVQSQHDAQGRIVGWFSWTADRSLTRAMDRLWSLVAIAGSALALCAVLTLRGAQRLARSLDHSTETVRKLTSEDMLTGLPNQRAMLERLDDILARQRSGIIVCALIDPDGFHEINDTLGRAGGDAVLLRIAEHLQTGLPAGALFGRFEEDEFAVVMKSDDPHAGAMMADALRASLLRPIFVDRMWQLTVSIGIAQAPEDGATAEELARRAGLALRAAKREGRGQTRRFEPKIEAEYAERRFLLRELESAISLSSFDVHYQLVVAAEGGGIVGVEALLRWFHPTRGEIPPAVFIPLAEQSGLMPQLGEIVLRQALSDGARWPSVFMAVNLSPLQIRDRWLVDLVGSVLAETGIAAPRVVLEVTEGVFIDNPRETQVQLETLRALGVRIALDDFGTGYSSLSYLQKFPFDRLKIDRTFVASLGTSGNAGAIIQSIVTLGHALGMKVLAEGVETDEQRVLLRLGGCDEMQGFLFARPLPAAEIDAMLTPPVQVAPQQPGAGPLAAAAS